MSAARPRVLAYVEDPGAANMVLGLAAALAERGGDLALYAGGTAAGYLTGRGEKVIGGSDAVSLTGVSVVCTGTAEDPATPAFALLAEARHRGLATVVLVDGPANADRRLRGTTGDPLAHAPDWLMVPDDATVEAYKALGFPALHIRVCGHPSLDLVSAEKSTLVAQGRAAVRRACFPNLDDDRPLILFLTELSDGLDPAKFRRAPDYTLAGRGSRDGRTEVVLEEVLDAAAAITPRPQVAVRLHPKTPRGLYAQYEGEAAVLGCNVLSVVPRESEYGWLGSNARGLTPHVSTREELRTAMVRALADPPGFMPAWPVDAAPVGAAPRIAAILAALAAGLEPPR